jgi:hypothetical protein
MTEEQIALLKEALTWIEMLAYYSTRQATLRIMKVLEIEKLK